MTPLVFLDTETTGVHPDRQVWEIAMIRRDETGTHGYQAYVEVDLAEADPAGLAVGRFYDRHPLGLHLAGKGTGEEDADTVPRRDVAVAVAQWTHGAHIVGANPAFDAESLAKLLRAHGYIPAWHYRLIDVEALTAGKLGRIVGGQVKCAEALGVEVDPDLAHTALGDAQTAMRIYDTVMGGAA